MASTGNGFGGPTYNGIVSYAGIYLGLVTHSIASITPQEKCHEFTLRQYEKCA